jgi:hypothetical protein
MPSRLIELEIPRPGIYGVNTSASGDVMPKEFATKTTNMVWSDEGYTEARRGSQRAHSSTLATIISGSAQTVRSIFPTKDESGNELIIFSSEDAIYKISGSTVTEITGTITTPTAGNWKFVNLNDKIVGFQSGHAAIELTTPSTGSFADITFTATGSETPTTAGSVAQDILAAAGRLWVLDGNQLRYSSLLDHSDFSTSTDSPAGDAGAFDLNAIQLNGEDKAVAITEFNGNLLVFFERHVAVFSHIWNPNGTDAAVSAGGGNVMQLTENIAGVGCIARDSIQHTQNDVLFLSEQGVTSLGRVVQEKSMPIQKVSANVRKEALDLVKQASLDKIWSVYLEGKGIYLIGHSDYRWTLGLDVGSQLPDGTYRATRWDKTFTTMGATEANSSGSTSDIWSTLLVSDETNYISRMRDYRDYVSLGGASGTAYDVEYESAWTAIVDELENNIKIPKKIGVTIKGSGTIALTVNIAFDYGSFVDSRARQVTVSLARESRYGSARYGGAGAPYTYPNEIGYYGSATSIKETNAPGFSKGRIMKVNVYCEVPETGMSLQRISIKGKLGRQS